MLIKLGSYDSIILDFDGVIIDSVVIKGNALKRLFADTSDLIQNEIYLFHILNGGLPRDQKIRFICKSILKKDLSETELEDYLYRFALLLEETLPACPLIPGVKTFLEKFGNLKDLYIVSAAPRVEIETILDKHNIRPFFKKLYGSCSSKTDIINQIVKNGTPQHTPKLVFLGDSLSDLEAALKSNIDFVGINLANNNCKSVASLMDFIE